MLRVLLNCGWLFLSFSLLATTSPMPEIQQIETNTTTVGQFEKLELTVALTADFSNPFDYDQVHLKAFFTASDGQQFTVDGFFQQHFTINTNTGRLVREAAKDAFKIRFAPPATGNWQYQLQLTDRNGTTQSDTFSFTCYSSDNQGFIKNSATNYLQHDNGSAYLPIGENMAWQSSDVYFDYKNWLTALSENGGNFMRLWHAHWGLGLEWKNGWQGFGGLRNYQQQNAAYQDWLFDFCTKKNTHVMLTLQHHGQISSSVNSEWRNNPYNQRNGGMCQNVWDFFSNEQAIADTKNRLRYIVARWGYSTTIMAWELFNEVDWMDEYAEKAWMVTQWHYEMAAFLKEIDPYQHLVTTSFAHADNTPDIWDDPNLDLTQTHFYLNNSHLERALCQGVKTYLEDFSKPTLTGEFGLGATASLSQADPDGIHLHNALWATLFSGAAGTAMTWWWDDYVHPNDLYYHFQPVAKLAQAFDFLNKNLRPEPAKVLGATGDLELAPTGDWGSQSDNFIIINEDGTTIPERVDLNLYLFGQRWNTDYRNPPVFQAHYPTVGEFSVQTSALTSTDPKIAIYLDGELLEEFDAQPNRTYRVKIPAGRHYIKVDNTGKDWITIANYSFTDLGKKVDVYALRSADKKTITGWVLNNNYNHQSVRENGVPNQVTDAKLLFENWQVGEYELEWFDCVTGEVYKKENFSGVNENLEILIPDLAWDLAFRIHPAAVVSSINNFADVNIKLYPNPTPAGSTLQLDIPKNATVKRVDLYNIEGKRLAQLDNYLRLPPQLAAGFYWLKVQLDQQLISLPLVITLDK